MKNLKKISSTLFLTVVALAITFTSCGKDDDDNNKNVLKFNPGKVEVLTGKTASVTVSGGITPYTVASKDQKIATVKVDKSMIIITGIGKGTTTITVIDKDKKNSGTISVTVKDAAAGLEFDKKTLNVNVGKEDVVTIKGGIAPYAVISKDAGIATATVKANKVTIKAVKAGTATITVTDKDKKNSGTITVTVKDTTGGLEFDKKTLNVNVGKEDVVTIKGGIAPYAAASKDAGIATATVKDSKVTIKGAKAGTTTITVTDKDKKNSATISVTVK